MTSYICCFCAPRLKDVVYSNWNRKQCEEKGIIRLLSKSASNDLKNLDKPRITFQYLHFKREPESVSQKSTCDQMISGKQSPKCIAWNLIEINLYAMHFGEQLKNHSNTSFTSINDCNHSWNFFASGQCVGLTYNLLLQLDTQPLKLRVGR